ncbi:hypothetical protein Tco_1385780 [Tanacetum coccineum]
MSITLRKDRWEKAVEGKANRGFDLWQTASSHDLKTNDGECVLGTGDYKKNEGFTQDPDEHSVDSYLVKGKGETRSLTLKDNKESSDEESLTSGSEDEEYAMSVRDFKKFFTRRGRDPNHLIGECLKPTKDKNQRAFVGGSLSDSGEDDDICHTPKRGLDGKRVRGYDVMHISSTKHRKQPLKEYVFEKSYLVA